MALGIAPTGGPTFEAGHQEQPGAQSYPACDRHADNQSYGHEESKYIHPSSKPPVAEFLSGSSEVLNLLSA
jgi:hypothetical protein